MPALHFHPAAKGPAMLQDSLPFLAACLAGALAVSGGPAKAAADPENTLLLDLKDGRVVIEMRPDLAPQHVARIKTLVREGFYDGLVFHRVIDGFMAQTGDPLGNGTGGSASGSAVTLTFSGGKYVGTLTAPSYDGNYSITVNATDIAGNEGTQTTTFTVNNATPTITASIANKTYVANGTAVTFTVYNASHIYYNTSEEDTITQVPSSSTSVTVNASTSVDKSFEIYLHVNNSQGAVLNATYNYTVDNVLPSLTPSVNNNQIVNGTLTITATATDADSGVAAVEFYFDFNTATATTLVKNDTISPYNYELSTVGLRDGTYTLNMTAIDNDSTGCFS